MALPREVCEKLVYYRREVDRIYNEYLRPGRPQSMSAVPAPVDIYETDDDIKIDIELPGVPAESIDVSVSTDVLVIEGERRKMASESMNDSRYHHAERTYGRFQRIVEVPRAANMGQLRAVLDHGLLQIRIPKVTDRRGQWRRIAVVNAPESGGAV